MNWLKKNYDKALLGVLALLLIVVSALLVLKSNAFEERFADAQRNPPAGTKLDPLDISHFQMASAAFSKPARWVPPPKLKSGLFVPGRYVITNNKPILLVEQSMTDSLTQKEIPNSWLLANRLNPLDPNVLKQDPDGDGFNNEDEWRGNDFDKDGDSTDPNNKDSHPDYVTKLFFGKYVPQQFLLKFQAYDGDPKKDKPEDMSFQINSRTIGARSEFKKIGETVLNGKFKIIKFEFKEQLNEKIGEKEEVSELTIQNVETGDTLILILGKETNSPDSYVLFDYQWNNKPLQVKKLQPFGLPGENPPNTPPAEAKMYKPIDIDKDKAVITLPSGEKRTIVPDPRKPRMP